MTIVAYIGSILLIIAGIVGAIVTHQQTKGK